MAAGNQNAVRALLSEYDKAVAELKIVVQTVAVADLIAVADAETTNTDCISIQSVLTHVVASGYSYAFYIRKHLSMEGERPQRKHYTKSEDYITALDQMLDYTAITFTNITDRQLEETDNARKILTNWKQRYDIEQLMEHAIVHILRHRRQIEKFRLLVSNT